MAVTGFANDTTNLFYAAEIVALRPGSAIFTFQEGHATVPNGTNAQFADNVGAGTSTITASDTGYRTSALLDGDPIAYPP